MSELITEDIDRNQFFDDYIATYLERDVRNFTQVGDLTKFHKFLIAFASRTGEVLNYNSLCEDSDIDAKTAKHWISILEANDIIYLLEPYFSSELKRATKFPKIIFLDTGFAHYLETFVISELIKNRRNNNKSLNYDIYYYRAKDGKEIDLIIKFDDVIYPFEIKKTANPTRSMINNYSILNKTKLNVSNGGILCFYPDVLPLDEKNKAYPLSVIF